MTCFHFISTQFYTNTNILWVNQHVFAYAKEHPSSYELVLLFFHLHRICKQEEAGILGKAIHHLETYCHFFHDHFALVTFFFFFLHMHFYGCTMPQHFSKEAHLKKDILEVVAFWYLQCLKIS